MIVLHYETANPDVVTVENGAITLHQNCMVCNEIHSEPTSLWELVHYLMHSNPRAIAMTQRPDLDGDLSDINLVAHLN